MSEVVIRQIRSADAAEIHALICLAYGYDPAAPGPYALSPDAIRRHIRRFAEGQFVAIADNRTVGYTFTMRTNRPPEAPALNWLDAIGGQAMTRHEYAGEWLYGVDFAVHPDYRRRGIGRKLYDARFALIETLNIRGFYTGGMLAGYRNHYTEMSIEEYGERVRRGDLYDPTITMQMNCGFKPGAVIKNYSGTSFKDHAMFIIRENPHYRERTESHRQAA